MPVMALVSAKGSPGVTTTAAALAAAAVSAGGDALLVELDPSGGDVAMLCDRVGEGALVSLAEQLRRGTPHAGTVRGHATEAPPGVPAVLAQGGANESAAVISSLGDGWLPALRDTAATVAVDAGRWEARTPTARRIAGADVVGLVCRATAPGVEHTRRMVDALRGTARCPLALLVVGTRPYPGDEIATVLDVPLGGVLAWDPRGATGLWADGAAGRRRRSWLARSAAAALPGLQAQVPARSTPARPLLPGSTGGAVR
jgi:hypothetical protein